MDGKLDNDYDYRILEEIYLEHSKFYPQFSTKNADPKFEPNWMAIRNDKTNLSFNTTYQESYKTLKAHRDNCEKLRVRDQIIHPVTFL